MSLPFIILRSIYETAICLGHCVDGSTALDLWHLESQDIFAGGKHEGLKTERLAQVAVKAFLTHTSKGKEYSGLYGT